MSEKKFEVTIGIPVCNSEKFIRMCMESALNQTFESIEFLIIDDCGNDSSISIIKEYQRTHLRGEDIRIVSQPKNLGIGDGRNRIIDEAKGRYLYFLDSDDKIAPNAIELLYASAEKYNAEMVYGSYEKIEEYGDEVKRIVCHYPNRQFLDVDEWPNYAYCKYGIVQSNVWNILMDVDVIRKNGLRFKSINYWEDFVFVMDLPTYVKRVVLLSEITYYYFCRDGSLSKFQKRDVISKEEIIHTVDALEYLKTQSDRIRHKTYFPLRMYKLMVSDFYIVRTIIRNKSIISPSFTNSDLRDIMRSPLSLMEILSFRQALVSNFVLYILGILPVSLSLCLIKAIAKKKLI